MSELPEGWLEAKLGDLVDIHDSRRIPLNSIERAARIEGKYQSCLFPYFGATGQVGWIDKYIFDGPHILLGEDGVSFFDPIKEKAYLATGQFWVNNHAHVLTAIENVADTHFLLRYLNRFDYTGTVTGSTRLKLTQGAMREIPIPLPPLPEQARIANKLDTLLARVDSARDRLDRVPGMLKRFRQAVLTAATSGVLTEAWRTDRNISNSWSTGTLSAILDGKPRNGYSPKSVDTETPVKSLTLTATTSGKFQRQYFKYIDEKIPSNSYLWLQPDDILIQRANTLEYVGVSAIYDGPSLEFIYPDLMMKARSNGSVLPKFLLYIMQSDGLRAHFRANATGTAGNMPKINQQTILNAPCCWPPLPEQTEIVRQVEILFAYADRLEARLKTARKLSECLTPAILAKAFRGELVPQDPNDEPAVELLKRIRAGRK